MKKLILTLIAGLTVALGVQAGVTTNANNQIVETFTNSFGQVFEVVIGTVGSTTVPTEIPNAQTIVVGTAAPSATPDQLGQIAIDRGQAAYVAVGGTSSDWTPVPQFNVLNSSTLGANYNLTNRTPNCIGEFVYAVSNVLSAATGAGTTGTVAVAKGLTVNDWVIVK